MRCYVDQAGTYVLPEPVPIDGGSVHGAVFRLCATDRNKLTTVNLGDYARPSSHVIRFKDPLTFEAIFKCGVPTCTLEPDILFYSVL